MELLRPTALAIHRREVQEDGAFEFCNLFAVRYLPVHGLSENPVGFFACAVLGIERVHAMVGKPAPHLPEEIMSFLQCVQGILVTGNHDAGDAGQFCDILLEIFRVIYAEHLVGPPCREHIHSERFSSYPFVPFERVGRVVCRADRLHIELFHQ